MIVDVPAVPLGMAMAGKPLGGRASERLGGSPMQQPRKEMINLTTQRTKQENLALYAEGWANGDAEKVLQAVAPSYQYGDPNGQASREEFREFHRNFISQYGDTMSINGVVSYEVGDKLVAGFVWEAGDLRGTGLITVGAHGVEREECTLL